MLGYHFEFEDATSSPDKHFSFFFFFFSHLIDTCIICTYLIGTARLWPQRDRLEVYNHPVGARVPFATRACAACNA